MSKFETELNAQKLNWNHQQRIRVQLFMTLITGIISIPQIILEMSQVKHNVTSMYYGLGYAAKKYRWLVQGETAIW